MTPASIMQARTANMISMMMIMALSFSRVAFFQVFPNLTGWDADESITSRQARNPSQFAKYVARILANNHELSCHHSSPLGAAGSGIQWVGIRSS
jgi:hypothetical protein